MGKFCRQFLKSDEGAVTVDFVVLTAAIVLLGLAVMSAIGPGATGLGEDIRDDMNTVRDMTTPELLAWGQNR